MKLILCRKCKDLVRLREEERRVCYCGESWGQYFDDIYAIYGGDCVPIGISNLSLVRAIHNQPDQDTGRGERFDAFVIPKQCKTMARIEEE